MARSMLLVLVGILAACSRTGEVANAGPCAALTMEASEYVTAHQGCTLDADCQGEGAFGFIYDHGSNLSCWYPVSLNKDGVAGFNALMQQMLAGQCTGPTNVCSGIVPAPTCKKGVCAP